MGHLDFVEFAMVGQTPYTVTKPLDFIIIGAQKSGSTFVHYCLEEHPQICMPHHEVHFFEDPVYQPNEIHQLEKLFENCARNRLFGIKRPRYLAAPECPGRIFQTYPATRLIVILRNPRDRAISAYYHYMKYGFLPVKNVEAGFQNILLGNYEGKYPGSREIIDFGFYAGYLKKYLTYFSIEQFSVIIFEELIKTPQESMQQLFATLGVDNRFVPAALQKRPQSTLHSLPRLKWITLRNPLIYRYDEERSRSYRKPTSYINKSAGRLIVKIDRRFLKYLFKNEKPTLSSELKESLNSLYASDIEELEEILGRDLAIWKG